MKKKVALIFGGRSSEHEISIKSIKNIFEALDKSKFEPILVGISKQGSWYQIPSAEILASLTSLDDRKIPKQIHACTLVFQNGKSSILLLEKNINLSIDIAFPVLHGTFGEDGTIQGYFKMMNLPFVGCGVLASAMGMDKEIMKRLLDHAGIKNAKSVLITKSQTHGYDKIAQALGSTFFIKPANSGSSVGAFKIKSATDFESKCPIALSYDEKVLAEEFIEGREIECSVKGLNSNPQAALPGEIIPNHEFYSYDAKYIDDNGAKIQIPASLDETTIQKIQDLAKKTYQILCCDGLTRVDFFLKKNGEIYVNEINTIPGFTNISMYPKMWEASGISYSDLITNLIQLAFEKAEKDNQIQFSFEALSSK